MRMTEALKVTKDTGKVCGRGWYDGDPQRGMTFLRYNNDGDKYTGCPNGAHEHASRPEGPWYWFSVGKNDYGANWSVVDYVENSTLNKES
jgi:hypothetical protein